jgi:glycogen phosphorylase
MIKPVATVSVVPDIPEALSRLPELAYNLRWSWDHETYTLFRRIDVELWDKTYHNPVAMLGLVSQDRLAQLAADPAFMAHYNRVVSEFDGYMKATDTWYLQHRKTKRDPVIAYFSMEFGLTECLQNYSGGLGVLSGDHLKSASDLGLPLVAVGLLYQEGYFQQYLNTDGYQQENYPINDYSTQPVTLVRGADNKPLKINVDLPGRKLYAQIWRVQVGRVPLFLLDTNLPDNPRQDDRNVTDRLYGGDKRQRIRQEILLGIGGIRALAAMGMKPDVCHMNEGHSAFLALERIRVAMEEHKISFTQAREITKAGNIFTTHTNVPAGLERFGYDLIDEHFPDYWRSMGLSREQFIALGRENMGDYELYSMAVLALNLSADSNGVAQLHGEVARVMWQWMYPNVPAHEVPIDAITNGIHVQTWISREMGTLFDRYIDPVWRTHEDEPEVWQRVDDIPDSELWRTHERRRERLVAFARKRLRQQLVHRGVSQSEIEAADEALNPDALTIGFVRRFATYKRATLIFRDMERLTKILNNPERPVQIIFAGKAHPHDEEGKAFIRHIVRMARTPELRHSIVFLENYDMQIARYLVQGVDVWLNNPRRPKEASGTSGMKVIYNGGLNCSILDGWWAEAYSPEVGWAIGNGEEYKESLAEQQDHIESQALYNTLEQDIIPLFYERGRDSLPRGWIEKVKASIKKLAPAFNTRRMVQQYADFFYLPTYKRAEAMTLPDLSKGIDYASWRSHVDTVWQQVQVKSVNISQENVKVGAELEVHAVVDLGQLKPSDVRVQLYCGKLDTDGSISDDAEAVDMTLQNENGGSEYHYIGRIRHHTSGDRGISVRVVPHHEFLPTPFQPGLITWA